MGNVTKEQEEEFKQRLANRKITDAKFKELPKKQLEAFLKATDTKCDGDG